MEDDDTQVLVRQFHSAQAFLLSQDTFADNEMTNADRASRMRLQALHELARRYPNEQVARMLEVSVQEVDDQLRVDRDME